MIDASNASAELKNLVKGRNYSSEEKGGAGRKINITTNLKEIKGEG